MNLRKFSAPAAIVLIASLAHAGVITGTVRNAAGQPVAGVNINASFSSGGGNPTLLNDGTDAAGHFTTTITPDGVYDITFVPPASMVPLVLVLKNVAVVGTVNLGTLTLPAGVWLSGTVRNHLNQPIGGVNLDVLDAGGNLLPTNNDFTDAFGNFQVAVPAGPITFQLDPGATVPLAAPIEMALDLAADTSLGILALKQGFTVSATVRRTNGTGVASVDVDVMSVATGQKLYTPGDNSSSTGLVDVVVPAGTYDVEFCPPFADHLVATTLFGKVVAATTNLGVITLPAGVVLSGTVQAFNGVKYANVDVDLTNASTGADVTLCADNTASNGTYAVVVPTGTFHVKFTPPGCLPLGSFKASSVVIAANKVQNGTLPSASSGAIFGIGTPGTGGLVPTLSGVCTPRVGNALYGLSLANARGGAHAFMTYSPTNVLAATLFTGGGILAKRQPLVHIKLGGAAGVAGAGSGMFDLPIANNAALVGLTLKARAYVLDPAAAYQHAWTPALHATIVL
ncbi:MAG: carboxypeptidase-like regulatory domain-containing protein [Planctomycetes bacterium]|nr:carboxypeptidase-like regulatory domain-containing protein [Planctomycetota bacterium]